MSRERVIIKLSRAHLICVALWYIQVKIVNSICQWECDMTEYLKKKKLSCWNRLRLFALNASVYHPENQAVLCTDCLVWIWRQTRCTRTQCVHTTVVFDYNYRCHQEKKVFFLHWVVLLWVIENGRCNESGLKSNESKKQTIYTQKLSTNRIFNLATIEIFAIFFPYSPYYNRFCMQ